MSASKPPAYDLAALHARVTVIGDPGYPKGDPAGFIAALKAELAEIREEIRGR